jgi:hypothetical protein
MVVQEEDIRTFVPGDADLLIAEAMLGGALTFQEIAESIERSPAFVSEKLKDPVLCAWVSRGVHAQIATRLGMIDAAMYRRALGGDVRAADLLYKRYGAAADIKLNVNVGQENFDLMSDDALNALLNRRLQERTIDVTPPPRDVGNGASAPQDRGNETPEPTQQGQPSAPDNWLGRADEDVRSPDREVGEDE